MPLGGGIAVGAGALLGGFGSLFGGKSQASASRDAAMAQLQAAREAIRAQERGAERGFDIFQEEAENARNFLREQTELARQDLEPLREIGLASLQQASGFADPDSAETQAERDAFARTLAQNLAARGLTASGAEVAGLRDFELGLARERRNTALNLAGAGANTLQSLASLNQNLGTGLSNISTGLGQTGGSIFGNLGQSIGNTIQQGAAQAGNLNVLAAQQQAQGLAGAFNALQGGILGGVNIFNQNRALRQSQDQFNRLFPTLTSGNNTGSLFPGSGGF